MSYLARDVQQYCITFLTYFPAKRLFLSSNLPQLSWDEAQRMESILFLLNLCQLLTDQLKQGKAFGDEYGNQREE